MSEGTDRMPRVLIVDDSRMVRASIRKQIRDKFDVREEVDGESGWQALLLDPTIEVVISDIDMPRLDGYGLLERIRNSRLSRINTLPVIFISGEDNKEVRAHAQQLGAVDFISKGTPRVELIARLDVLTKLAQTRRELRQSHEQFVLANRGDVSVMVVDIDHYADLCNQYGNSIGQLVHRKISRLLLTKVRSKDTVAHLAEGQFAVICPSADINACGAFALRLLQAIETVVMVYKSLHIQVSLTIGLASAHGDESISLEQLLQLALQRVAEGHTTYGGNCVVAEDGRVTSENISSSGGVQITSVDLALTQLRSGNVEEVRKRLRELTYSLFPLLEFMESEYHCDIPLAALSEKAQTTSIEPFATPTIISNTVWHV